MLCKVLCRHIRQIRCPHYRSCEELGQCQGQKCSVVSLQSYSGLHRNLRGRKERVDDSRVECKSHASQLLDLSHKILCLRGRVPTDR